MGYLHEDSVPNMADPGAVMEKEREGRRGGGVSGYTAGVINAQCNQPRQMLILLLH